MSQKTIGTLVWLIFIINLVMLFMLLTGRVSVSVNQSDALVAPSPSGGAGYTATTDGQ